MFQSKLIGPLAIFLGAVVAIGGAHFSGRSVGAKKERAKWEVEVQKAGVKRIKEYEEQLTKFNLQAIQDERNAKQLLQDVSALRAQRDLLALRAIPLVKIKEVPVNVQGKCVASVLSSALGLCIQAAVTGEPAATAACQAAGSDAPATSGASF